MAAGCTNPAADNYDPSATSDDGSCLYTVSIASLPTDPVGPNVCYLFSDYSISNTIDKSYTMSYAIESNNWVFFHSYIPDYYFHTREHLHLTKNSKVYTSGQGSHGQYLGQTVQPFFIDIVFNYKEEQTLDAVKWISEMISIDPQDQEFKTFTHITIWNNYQSTGKISLAQAFDNVEVTNLRRTKSEWNFNDFRDIVLTRGTKFLKDIFNDYAQLTATLDINQPWFEKRLMEDNYFIVRLEYDNIDDNDVFLHEAEALITPSTR